VSGFSALATVASSYIFGFEYTPNNKFVWDGGTGIALSLDGFNFATNDPSLYFSLFSNDGGLSASTNLSDYQPTNLFSSYGDSANATTIAGITSSLTPAATPVPFDFDPSFGLLALGGVWTARKMIKKSKSVVKK